MNSLQHLSGWLAVKRTVRGEGFGPLTAEELVEYTVKTNPEARRLMKKLVDDLCELYDRVCYEEDLLEPEWEVFR